jgi:hypothetical protein
VVPGGPPDSSGNNHTYTWQVAYTVKGLRDRLFVQAATTSQSVMTAVSAASTPPPRGITEVTINELIPMVDATFHSQRHDREDGKQSG